MPGQGIVGSPRGEAEPLGDLAGASGPAQQLGGFDLGAELGADDAQQHDGRGLLAPLLVGRGRFFGLGEACGEIQIGLVLSDANGEREPAAGEKELSRGKKNVGGGFHSTLKTSLQPLPRAHGDKKILP